MWLTRHNRIDLKQVVVEFMVSQDGGIPLLMQSWDGNANDSKILRERAKQLIENFKKSEAPRYLIADSKLYDENTASYLSQLKFITRIPNKIKLVKTSIEKSLSQERSDLWKKLDEKNQYQTLILQHYGIEQRWLVVKSQASLERAQKNLSKQVQKEGVLLRQALKVLSKENFTCAQDAQKAITKLSKTFKYYRLKNENIVLREAHGKSSYQIEAAIEENKGKIQRQLDNKSCYVIGSNISSAELDDKSLINAYKGQNKSVENMGFRFLKDPIFFTSSLFIKKESRIEGLIMIMTLALLVYSIAQRRLRQVLEKENETLPNQINQPTQRITMRWAFQLLEGINVVRVRVLDQVKIMIEGLNPLKEKIIKLLGGLAAQIYFQHEKVIQMT